MVLLNRVIWAGRLHLFDSTGPIGFALLLPAVRNDLRPFSTACPYVSLKTRRFTCGLPETGGAFLLRMIDGVMNVLAERIFDQNPRKAGNKNARLPFFYISIMGDSECFRALLFSSICYSFSNGNFSAAIVNLIRQLDSPIVRKGSDDSVVVDRSIHGSMRNHH